MLNPKDISDPTTAMNMALVIMAKAFKLNYSTPTNNNQRISSNLRNRQIAQLDGSAEVHHSENCYDNDIFNMFTQEEYVEQSGGAVEQNPATVEETRAIYDSLYNNLAIQKQQSLYNGKVLLEKHDPPVVYDSEETLQLAQEKADESLAKHKALEYEIERLLRAAFSQDIISIVQNPTVVETSDL
ncbi:hypothetical protein Tco_0693242 [Tanacetum coccineum]